LLRMRPSRLALLRISPADSNAGQTAQGRIRLHPPSNQ
jgi:hypothetical protein